MNTNCVKTIIIDPLDMDPEEIIVPPPPLPPTPEDERLCEIVIILNREDAYWGLGVFFLESGGVSKDDLLLFLQAEYPSSMWDMTLLEEILLLGLKRGVLKTNPMLSVEMYWLSVNMVRVDCARNEQFRKKLPNGGKILPLKPLSCGPTIAP